MTVELLAAHQPARRPMGRRLCQAACVSPGRWLRRHASAPVVDFIIIYRLSMLDLVNDGSTLAEVTELAKAIEAAGATIINTGIGWHEARIPTIATPAAARSFQLGHPAKLKGAGVDPAGLPPTASTTRGSRRIFSPAAMPIWYRWPARSSPTPNLCRKRMRDRARGDQYLHRLQPGVSIGSSPAKSPLVWSNPRACHETLMPVLPANAPKRLAVVGARAGRSGLLR